MGRFVVHAQGAMRQEPKTQRAASMAETATPHSGIARDEGTIATTATTTFRGLRTPASLKASWDSAQDPSCVENKMKKRRQKSTSEGGRRRRRI